MTLVEWTEEVEGDGPDLLCQLELPVHGNTTSKPAAAPAARPLLAKGDWPLPRPIDLQHLCSVLSQIPYFSDGADGHVPVSLDSLAAFKAFIRDHYTAEEADKAIAQVLALEDLADAATRGADDDDLDLSALIGFYRAGNAVQKIVAPCITADDSGDGLLLVMGTLRIPGTQVGTDVKFGGLSADAVIDVSWHTNSPAFFSLELADKEEWFLFEVALAVQPEYRYSQLKAALAYGKTLAQLLSVPAHDGYVTTAKQRTDLETLLSSGAPASPPVDAAAVDRRSRLEWLKEKPGRDLQIVKLNDDEFLQDGMTFPVEYVSTSKNRQGGI